MKKSNLVYVFALLGAFLFVSTDSYAAGDSNKACGKPPIACKSGYTCLKGKCVTKAVGRFMCAGTTGSQCTCDKNDKQACACYTTGSGCATAGGKWKNIE